MTNDSEKSNEFQPIKEFGIVKTGSGIEVITIIGQIEGHFVLNPETKSTKYEHILPSLVSIEENDDVNGLLILLNTVGGDVEAGLAIAEMISSMKKPTVSLVLGGGHSIGVPLAVSAKKSFIVPSATMTLHPVRTTGTIIGVEQAFSNIEKMQKRVIKFVSRNSNISEERFEELVMNVGQLVNDVGTMVDGVDAVKEGIIDNIGGLKDALDALYEMIKEYEKDKKQKSN